MRTMHPRCLAVLFAIGLVPALHAQDRLVRSGNKAHSAMAYERAVERYEQAALRGAPPPTFARNLAHSYDRLHDAVNAAKWYNVVVQLPDVRDAELYAYARSLRAIGDYAGADHWMSRYQAHAPTDSRILRQQDAVGFAERSGKGGGCTVQNLTINTADNEMGVSYQGEQLVFASDRRTAAAEQRLHAWNARPFLDLFSSTQGPDASLDAPVPLQDLNTKYHESNATFSTDGLVVYFTRNAHHQGHTGQDDRGVVNLRIYQRTFRNGAWCDETPFIHNSDHWSVGHPCLDAQGDRLYFASDRPGGMGGTDIWYCERTDGAWGPARNLGPAVNTEGDELFPSIDAHGLLTFASDGHQGLGGLDILLCPLLNGEALAPHNPGAPLNSVRDDLGLILDGSGRNGHFTSDRDGGKGRDDLYAVHFEQAPYPEMRSDGPAIASASPTSFPSDPAHRAGSDELAQNVSPEADAPKKDTEHGADRRIAPLHYGVSQWAVDPAMAAALDELVALLLREPHLLVEVQGHADSRGRAEGNLALSRRRAKSCAEHLIARGVPAERVKWKGFGETRPVNDRTTGQACEEALHRADRRTEFFVRPL